ncbi:MAG: gliding motility-associated C-terminal domain-containing protein [Chitinophagaceae bacterium]|nr:gliding motility-associated C-terminal domain-containing protein [Chitinophagaceae bacterium]
MKSRFFILLFSSILLKGALFAQRAYDGEVMMGLNGVIMKFINSNIPILDTPKHVFYLYSAGSSSIADKNGRLLLASSNYTLADRNGDSILNGGGLNFGLDMDKMGYKDMGWSKWPQSSIILPKGDNGQYYVFTTTMSDSAFDEWQNFPALFRFDRLTYHIVDMNANGGKGEVIEKNKMLMKDMPIASNRMTAVKHANGRDWWLVKPHQKEHIFYTFLVTEQGISAPLVQSFNFPPLGTFGGTRGQSCFNRKGDMYAYGTEGDNKVYVFNFDRCNGTFSPYHVYPIAKDSVAQGYRAIRGVCFSPNDKLLYASSPYQIYQIDIADTSEQSIIYGHHYVFDSVYFPFYNNLYLSADDRIYVGTLHCVLASMSYFNTPNERGLASGYCTRCLVTPYANACSLPNIPNYHLGALVGSACDSIRPPIPIPEEVIIVPNAFSPNGDTKNDTWHILNSSQLLAQGISIEACGIYNRLGNKVYEGKGMGISWNGLGYAIDTYFYFIKYKLKDGTVKIKKGDITLLR